MKHIEIQSNLVNELRQIITEAQKTAMQNVNTILTLMYWEIGHKIQTEILHQQRADYGKQIIATVSQELTAEFGKGFNQSSLTRMINFAKIFTKQMIIEYGNWLSWSHFVELLKIHDDVKRDFYITLCRHEHWSVRVLRERINSMMFERTALAKKPEQFIRQELINLVNKNNPTPQTFLKDPYLLDFLQLGNTPSEKDLENAILQDLEKFILEFGSDFAFMGRQKRIQIGNQDYYLDLLFYHRSLKRLILIELKLGEFKPEYKGQVELYLKWLEKYEKRDDENPPIAIILCSGKDDDVIELLDLNQDRIHVSDYWLQLPSKQALKHRLQFAIEKSQHYLN